MSNTIQHGDWTEVAETLQAVSDNIKELTPEYTFFHSVMEEWRLTTFKYSSVSIVTRELEQPFVVVENGTALAEAIAIQEHPTLNKLVHNVESVIKSEKNFSKKSDGSQQTMIIPMRLRDERILGAFILSREGEEYSSEEIEILDQFSNRIALLLNSVLQNDYAANAEDFRLKMVENNHDASRQAILASALEFLIYSKKGNDTNSQQRFDKKEVHLFLYDTVDSESLYHEINAGNLTYNSSDQSERTPIPVDGSNSDIPINQTLIELVKTEDKPKILRGDTELKEYQLSPDRVACLIEPIRIFDGRIIGYLVLTNPPNKNEYDDDIEVLDRLSNYIGSALRRHRDSLRENTLNEYRRNLLNPDDLEKIKDEERYNKIHELITAVIGKKPLYIVTFERKSQQLNFVYPNNQNSTSEPPNNIKELIREYIDGHRIKVEESNGYLLAPMKTKNQIHGCFVLQITNVGNSDRIFVDRLSDLLAFEQKLLRNQERTRLMIEFSYDINQLSCDEKTVLGDALELVKKYTSQVMATDNMWIALRDDATSLHNKENNSVAWLRFPLLIKNGQTLEELLESDPNIKNPDRPWSPENTSRAEVIMTEPDHKKAAMMCRTKVEAEEYYKTRTNPLGDTLASFLGVPIYLDDSAVGVIAVYHPEKDYCFSYNDQRFLESLAGQVSGLLRLIREKEANRKLEEANRKLEETNRKLEEALKNNSLLKEANKKIAEQQHSLSTALLAQDLIHRLNNTVGAIAINVSQTQRDLETAETTNDMSHFTYTKEGLDDINNLIGELAKEIQAISDDTPKPICINDMILKISSQVRISKRLDEKGIQIVHDFTDCKLTTNAHYRTLFNAFYALAENSIFSLNQAYQLKNEVLELIINIKQENNHLVIKFTDTGTPIPTEIESHLFEYGNSGKGSTGFGLWRTKSIIENLQGSITYQKDKNSKTFTIKIPKTKDPKEKIALILDDERSWRNILNHWMSEEGYQTHPPVSGLLSPLNYLKLSGANKVNNGLFHRTKRGNTQETIATC